MRIIGITGGVGAGKTHVLSYIESHYNCIIIRADEVAHLLEEPGQKCYESLVALLGREVLREDNTIDKKKMAGIIFSDSKILMKVNEIIHPAVKLYIVNQIEKAKKEDKVSCFFIEAALLIEERYDLIVDEMWYIYADEEVRSKRLAANRQYSNEKIESIMRGQLKDSDFRKHCQKVISNNGDLEDTYRQIKEIMGE